MKLYDVEWQRIWTGTSPEDMAALQRYCKRASDLYYRSLAIEVGTHCGASAALISEWFETVVCVDPWGQYTVQPGELIGTYVGEGTATLPEFGQFVQNMEKLDILRRMVPIVNTVKALDNLFERGINLNAALAFVDDGHTYHDCRRDIAAVMRHLSPLGLLVCHDYYGGGGPCGSYIGVEQAVDEAIQIHGLEVFEHSGGIIAMQRRAL